MSVSSTQQQLPGTWSFRVYRELISKPFTLTPRADGEPQHHLPSTDPVPQANADIGNTSYSSFFDIFK